METENCFLKIAVKTDTDPELRFSHIFSTQLKTHYYIMDLLMHKAFVPITEYMEELDTFDCVLEISADEELTTIPLKIHKLKTFPYVRLTDPLMNDAFETISKSLQKFF